MARYRTAGIDEKLIVELASGKNLCESAAAVGVTERTVQRRWADPAFRVLVARTRGDLLAQAGGRLVASLDPATKVLHDLLKHSDPNVRLKAAVRAIALAVQVSEIAEIERRMDRMEELLHQPPTRVLPAVAAVENREPDARTE